MSFSKEAKLKYKPGSYDIVIPGDYVVCKVSGKRISLQDLKYWNVELQEPYYSYVEAFQKMEHLKEKK